MKVIVTIIIMLSAIWCKAQTYLPPATITGSLEQGLRYGYQEGSYTTLPLFPTTLIQDTAYNFLLSKAKRPEYFAIQFEGYVQVPSDNAYTFYTKSDDGSKLWIDNVLVVDNDGLHYTTEKSGVINLKAGKHSIKVGMFNGSGIPAVLEVNYSSPNISKKAIPVSMLFRVKATTPVPKPSSFTTAQLSELDGIINKKIADSVKKIFIQSKDVKQGQGIDTLIIK